ncbi:hypothetical protein UA08_03695 [Talaromyces atroroseus]|uniref:Uncharacterized protein n=1 Tax=Talaromyces atroroseus TaxID=1441469 RepID=A0A225AND1_TALAT|nr:hypothetical protein UA08_03695 [Talaromyces atroroseus]OKL60963.1 hypothetical protein UA08_03695 [Talaromyces atroroseus]
MSAEAALFYAVTPGPGETQEQAEIRAHTPACSRSKPTIIEEGEHKDGKNIEVAYMEVRVVNYTDCSDMNIFAKHISYSDSCIEDVVIAIGRRCVVFARLPCNECPFCLEASSKLVRYVAASYLMEDTGVELYLLIPVIKYLGGLRPAYISEEHKQAHIDTLKDVFFGELRKTYRCQLHPFVPHDLSKGPQPTKPIIQVGNWNKNGFPAVRINDDFGGQSARIVKNRGQVNMDSLTIVAVE